MKKNQSNTTASLDAQEKQALAVLEQIRNAKVQAAALEQNKIAEFIKGIPLSLAKLTGKENLGFGEVISLIKQVEKGTLGKVGMSVGANHGQHAKRLTDAEEAAVKEAYIGRAVALEMKQTPRTISDICKALDISGQTYDARRKKYDADESVKAIVAERVLAMTPASAPAALATA